MDNIVQIFAELDLKYKAQTIDNDGYTFDFLEEMPPTKTQVTSKLLEIINKAEKSIKIIQPYV